MKSIKLLAALVLLLGFSLVAHNYLAGRSLDPRPQVERSAKHERHSFKKSLKRERSSLDRAVGRKSREARRSLKQAKAALPGGSCTSSKGRVSCKGKALHSSSRCSASFKTSLPSLSCRP